ncbi:MAG: hypothetical protein J5U17_10770 [Candidatus Methanoperedens sp.]|nr:hypothetical protein [Candidatus Methanoperedens sp.]MCE8428784.1 hypothetical protein [Candidatus Methanoperedens sp.]
MVAVLNWRKSGISEYILFEISTCLKARKPLLVFIEDILPNDIIPPRILQSRFSRQSFLRQIREHKHSIQIMNTYLGTDTPPKYQPAMGRRSCLITGISDFPKNVRDVIIETIDARGYSPIEFDESTCSILQDQHVYEVISTLDLAICVIESKSPMCRYLIGAVQMAFIPTILFTIDSSYHYNPHIPKEYQPRIISSIDSNTIKNTINAEVNLFEEDILNLDDEKKIKKYSELLLQLSSAEGRYKAGTNYIFTNEVTMRDKYDVKGAGAVGPGAHAHHITFNQIWNENESEIDLPALAAELSKLRLKLKDEATEAEHYSSMGAIASAESCAKKGDGPGSLEYLSKAGKWALNVATTIGVPVATEALKKVIGL